MTTLLLRLRAELRQRRHHRPFRIAAPTDEPLSADVDAALTELLALAEGPRTPTDTEPALDESTLADAVTSLWRAQRKLAQAGDETSRYAKQSGRLLELCRTSLAGLGIVVQDHDGDPYHPGRRIDAVSFEDDPDADNEYVRRTLRPSIYFQDRHIQTGQVVVACPAVTAIDDDAIDTHGGNHA